MDRVELLIEVSGIADQIAELLSVNPVRAGYPLPEVLAELATHHIDLRATVEEYPFPLAVDTAGHPDDLGGELAGLLSHLQHIQVLYRELDDFPAGLRARAARDFAAAHLRACRVRDRG